MLKNFYIFRHGQSSYNMAGRLQGQSNDSVLTENGVNQALDAASRLLDKNIDIIFSSPQRRAKQTGYIVAQRLHKKIQYDSRLAEVNLGTADGVFIDKLSKKEADILSQWQHSENSKNNARFPKGESKEELRQRILSVLKDIAASRYNNIAVSSHHFSIKEFLENLNVANSNLDNGEIVHLQYENGDWKYVQTLN